MAAWEPNGYFISNGPGDPSVMGYAIETVKKAVDSKKPLFGICLGHQLLALASGLSTYKMHHGHRGLNHPVKNLISGKGEMTSQNHGFAVSDKGNREERYRRGDTRSPERQHDHGYTKKRSQGLFSSVSP